MNFDDRSNEQDTATDSQSIGVTTDGQVGAGENLDSTESIQLTDTSPTTEVVDDPGTENDLPATVDDEKLRAAVASEQF